MSIKTTRTVSRDFALDVLLSEIPSISNDVLEELLDALADSKQSTHLSYFDNFNVINKLDAHKDYY